MQTCSVEGCSRKVQARRKCNTHYRSWYKAKVAATGAPLGLNSNNSHDALAAAMPATTAELVTTTGMQRETVWCAVKVMLESDPRLAHIGDWKEPQYGVKGSRWVPVFFAGPGADKKLTKAMKRTAMLASRARWRAAKRNKPRLQGLEAALFRQPKEKPMSDKIDLARRRVLEALARCAPGHSMVLSALGYEAWPESNFRAPQGAALACSRIVAAMRDDGQLALASRGYTITNKGRDVLAQLQAKEPPHAAVD